MYVVAWSGLPVSSVELLSYRQARTWFTPRMLIETKQARETRLIELVETNNIARALKRIKAAPHGSDRDTWKMAIYHAMFLAGCWPSELESVRKALALP